MKVALTLCIIALAILSVYSEDPSIKEASLSRETRDASPVKKNAKKDGKFSRKKQRRVQKAKSKSKKGTKIARKEKRKLQNMKKKSKKGTKIARKEKRKLQNMKKKSKGKKTKDRNRKNKRSRKRKKKSKRKNRKLDKAKKNKSKKMKRKQKKIRWKNKKGKGKRKKSKKQNKSQRNKSQTSYDNRQNKNPNCQNNTPANNRWTQADRFGKKYKLLSNKLDNLYVFKNYASLLGKVTNNGIKNCNGSQSAIDGFLLMNGCETSAAAACNNTQFKSLYLTAKDCKQTINCTNVPKQCNIKKELDALVKKTKECTNKTKPGTYSYCMNYVKEKVSADIDACWNPEVPSTPTPNVCTCPVKSTLLTSTTRTTAPITSPAPVLEIPVPIPAPSPAPVPAPVPSPVPALLVTRRATRKRRSYF